MAFDPRHKSHVMLDGPDRAFARSYFKAIGFTDEDLRRPLIGVAHCWAETTPSCAIVMSCSDFPATSWANLAF